MVFVHRLAEDTGEGTGIIRATAENHFTDGIRYNGILQVGIFELTEVLVSHNHTEAVAPRLGEHLLRALWEDSGSLETHPI